MKREREWHGKEAEMNIWEEKEKKVVFDKKKMGE